MKIILVRHGQTEWNKKDIFRGRKDIPLDESGQRQAMLTSRQLVQMNLSVQKVYTSPLQRAVETAEIIARIYELQVIVKNELIEIDCGQWEGRSVDEVKKEYPQQYSHWLRAPKELDIPGAETLEEVQKRVKGGVDSILKESKENIVIVAHKVINKIIIGCIMNWNIDQCWMLEQDLAAINVIEIDHGHAVVQMLNHTTHLLHQK